MEPKIPQNASDYRFYRDARFALYKIRQEGGARRDNYRGTLTTNDLSRTVVARDGGSYSLLETLRPFMDNGLFSWGSQWVYDKHLEAQRVADANGDGKFDIDEYKIFDAIRIQDTNTVGGVKLNINNHNIKNIRSIKKLQDGRIMVSLGQTDTTSSFIFKPQAEGSKASIDIPEIGDKVEFKGMSQEDYTVNPKD